MVTDDMGATTLLECSSNDLTTYELNHIVPLLTALETYYGCAGMCENPTFYLFSDVGK